MKVLKWIFFWVLMVGLLILGSILDIIMYILDALPRFIKSLYKESGAKLKEMLGID